MIATDKTTSIHGQFDPQPSPSLLLMHVGNAEICRITTIHIFLAMNCSIHSFRHESVAEGHHYNPFIYSQLIAEERCAFINCLEALSVGSHPFSKKRLDLPWSS